jgi:hypothetical protein
VGITLAVITLIIHFANHKKAGSVQNA